nr:gustatory receptor 12 [Achelura yunnanensis]
MNSEGYIPPGNSMRRRATFQAAMRLTLLIGQCFGLSPVLGVTNVDTSKMRFKYVSWRCLYSLLSMCGQCLLVGFCFINLLADSNVISSHSSLIFNGLNGLTNILFFRIAMKWPKLCQLISWTEAANPCLDETLITKCNFSCLVILSMALVEHILSDLSGFAAAVDCGPSHQIYRTFVTSSFPWIFIHVPYSEVTGALAQLLNIQCTFNWNFSNVFIICTSFYLTSRLEQVNKRIIDVIGKKVPSSFWRVLREDYSRLTYVVKRVDDVIGSVIFVSFASNLFFICLQLLHTLEDGIKAIPVCNNGTVDKRPLKGYEQPIYFVYSLVFLIIRSLAVSLVASKVHTASREPAYALYEVPSAEYCGEIQRFLDQIHSDDIALTGVQFFSVKRGIILTIAGTIITYELVLIQFTTSSKASAASQINTSTTSSY